MEREASKDEKFRAWLSLGGMRQARRGAPATVYSVSGPNRERETAAGGTTLVGYMLDPRLKLTARQRATGQCYGAYTERRATGGSSEFLKVFVDGGSSGSGGYSESQAMVISVIDVANEALGDLSILRYRIGKRHGDDKLKMGPHHGIDMTRLAHGICVMGFSLEHIALNNGWWVERRDDKGSLKIVVPDRQRKAVAEGLRVALDAIDAAWDAWGFSPPFEFGGVEVE